jgi:alkanesulfonate monooxygenase SsuD/methylene tetrahydromethanopterin reductase-like flavin-dependent oxidoreductase (luciferase family)
VLAGTPDMVGEAIADYRSAGATDLMLGFADFPATTMLETFAEAVLPHLG